MSHGCGRGDNQRSSNNIRQSLLNELDKEFWPFGSGDAVGLEDTKRDCELTKKNKICDGTGIHRDKKKQSSTAFISYEEHRSQFSRCSGKRLSPGRGEGLGRSID